MSRMSHNVAGRWFQRVLWLGIAANVALAVPTCSCPSA